MLSGWTTVPVTGMGTPVLRVSPKELTKWFVVSPVTELMVYPPLGFASMVWGCGYSDAGASSAFRFPVHAARSRIGNRYFSLIFNSLVLHATTDV